MRINNYKQLLRKKQLLKEAISIQESEIKSNLIVSGFSKFKNNKKLGFSSNNNNNNSNPKIEEGVHLALTTISSQLLKNKKLKTFPKVIIGLGILVTGKFITNKVSSYIDNKKKSTT